MERMFSKVKEDPTVTLEDVQDHLIPHKRALGLREIAIAKKFAKRYVVVYVFVGKRPLRKHTCSKLSKKP